MIEPLAGALDGYFHFHGLKGGLLKQAGREPRGARRLHRGDGACQHCRRGRPHPHAARPAERARHGETMSVGVGVS